MLGSLSSARGDEGVLEQALTIVRNRKWVVIQSIVVVTLFAAFFSLSKSDEYTATASLLFRPDSTDALTQANAGGFVDPAREAATNEQLVSLPAVAERASERLRGRVTPGYVASTMTVAPSGDANITRISSTTGSPQLSSDIANAYGEAYIEFRRSADRERVQSAITTLESNLAVLSPRERGGPAGRPLEDRLAQLKLALALQTGNAELVQRASPPGAPTSPSTKRNVALGVILGGLFGFLLAALLERLDRRIKSAEEVEELYALPLLARVPKSKALAGHDARGAPLLDPPTAGAFQALRANLRNYNIDRELRTIVIVGQEPGSGKSTVARQLALTMAEVRDSVVFVEADLHKPGAPARPGAGSANGGDASRTGLSTVLEGMPLKQALVTVPLPRGSAGEGRVLTVLPAGRPPANPSELLAGERMRLLLDELEERFEFVIVDTPALAVASDALPLAPAVSGLVIVSAVGRSTRQGAEELRKQLMLVGGHQLGVVANFAAPHPDGYHRYYERLRAIAHS